MRDTGIGIAADKLGAIFEDFSQANTSTTREFGGTGLGLSIARNLVQLHGGQLGVTSTEGRGSEFFFELPYEVADARAAQPEAHASLPTPFKPALHVLVAEDNALNQLVARKTLEAWNVQVVSAENGRLAVKAVVGANQPFDAVLMDVQMPEMDGYEAARRLRQLFPEAGQLPIIGLTASVLPEDRALALAAGMNDTLAKPFEPAGPFTYQWHMGDGTTLTGPAVSYCYKERKNYVVQLDVIVDKTGEIRRGQKYIPVNLIAQDIVDFTAQPSRVRVDQSVLFNAPEAQLLTCRNVQLIWDFRDGTIVQGRTAQHVFRRAGTYSVRFSMRGYNSQACVASHCVSREIVVEP